MEKEYEVKDVRGNVWEGKKLLNVTLADGTEATIWEDQKDGSKFPLFETITWGSKINGNLWKNPKTGKFVIYPVKPRGGASRGQSGAVEAAKVTGKSVEKAIERKGEGIKISATQRDAVLCAIAEYQEDNRLSRNGITLEKYVEKWRKYHWEHYDVNDSTFDVPF